MADPGYISDQVPTIDFAPRSPQREYDRPARVSDWDRVKSGSLATLPTRDDREASPDERTGQVIRVLLVDDHLSFRQPLAFMLLREPDITIIGQATTVAEARPFLPEADIALIDLDLPDEEGVVLIHELQAVNPTATALVLTDNVDLYDSAHIRATDTFMLLDKFVPFDEIISVIRISALKTATDSPAVED
jgi:response regulator RpfG family c-di-GMP phosphodiesterase